MRRRILLFVVSALAVCSAAVPQPRHRPPSEPVAATADATQTFEIVYVHRVRNRQHAALDDIVVFLPVPQSSSYQKIHDLEWRGPGGRSQVRFTDDEFGQEIACVDLEQLDPGERVEVGFRCVVSLGCPQAANLDEAAVGSLDEVPAELRALYTRDCAALDCGSELLRRRAGQLTDGRSLLADVEAIHDFVAGHLRYARDGRWDPAPDVLERGSGSCSEFSYLFVALCRASGIPARFVGATLDRSSGESGVYEDRIWHRWVQVYLPGPGWVHVDVTRDRGTPPTRRFFGRHVARCLILSYGGPAGRYLGHQYVGANTHADSLSRERVFTWRRLDHPADIAPGVQSSDAGEIVPGIR